MPDTPNTLMENTKKRGRKRATRQDMARVSGSLTIQSIYRAFCGDGGSATSSYSSSHLSTSLNFLAACLSSSVGKGHELAEPLAVLLLVLAAALVLLV